MTHIPRNEENHNCQPRPAQGKKSTKKESDHSSLPVDTVDQTFSPQQRAQASKAASKSKKSMVAIKKAAEGISRSLKTYDVKWKFGTLSDIKSSPRTGPDGTVYAGCWDYKLRAIKNGKLSWEYETGNISSSPCIGPDGTIYAADDDHFISGGGVRGPKMLYAIKDGQKLWDFELEKGTRSSPCVSPDGTVYIGSWEGKLYAVKDGKKVWDFQAGPRIVSSPCIGPDGTIYFGSTDGKLYAIKDGEKLWDFETEDAVTSSPCLGPDGTVYVGSDDKKLYAIKDGQKLWDFETESYVQSSPCLGPDGTVYIGSYDNNFTL